MERKKKKTVVFRYLFIYLFIFFFFLKKRLFDRAHTNKLLDDTMIQLMAALQSCPPSEEYLYRLMTFFGSRSTEQDRAKTLRGGAKDGAAAAAAGGKEISKSNSAALLMQAAQGKESGSAAWKQQFPNL